MNGSIFRACLSIFFCVFAAASPAADDSVSNPERDVPSCLEFLSYQEPSEFALSAADQKAILSHVCGASNFRDTVTLLRKHFTQRKALPAVVLSEALLQYLRQKLTSLFLYGDGIDRFGNDLVSQVLTSVDESKLTVRVYDDLHVDLGTDGKVLIHVEGAEERAEWDIGQWLNSRRLDRTVPLSWAIPPGHQFQPFPPVPPPANESEEK